MKKILRLKFKSINCSQNNYKHFYNRTNANYLSLVHHQIGSKLASPATTATLKTPV